jgi:hypothetical protein
MEVIVALQVVVAVLLANRVQAALAVAVAVTLIHLQPMKLIPFMMINTMRTAAEAV